MAFFDKAEMGRCATENGFQRDVFEKVYRLKETLCFLNAHSRVKRNTKGNRRGRSDDFRLY